MRLLAPAKINLHLRVGPPAEDGFHPLLSWFCTIGLFDTLTLTRNPRVQKNVEWRPGTEQATGRSGDEPFIELSTDFPDLPTDDRNLIVRVAKGLADTLGPVPTRRREGVSAVLEKRIPMGAGLGGGSSDAARMLLGLNSLWGIGWPAQRLSEFSARFGSDLPFFFHGPSSICTGRGQNVRPINLPSARWTVLMLPAIHMATPAVYRRFDEMRLGRLDTINPEPDWNAWSGLSADKLLPQLVNDLEAAAFSLSPELQNLHRAAEKLLGRTIRMSGSGSSLFTLFDSQAAADEAAQRIQSDLNVPAQALLLTPKLSDDLSV
jgi:4-diphosphocytidyl-2-C-methyl-D-erythritol kinase